MSSKQNMNMSRGILIVVGIVIGMVLAIVYNYMTSFKEKLDIPSIIPDIPTISPKEQQEILDGDWSDFKDWIDNNIKTPDDDYIKKWVKVDEDLEKELIKEDSTEKIQ